jgi:putative DNA primase/helicase
MKTNSPISKAVNVTPKPKKESAKQKKKAEQEELENNPNRKLINFLLALRAFASRHREYKQVNDLIKLTKMHSLVKVKGDFDSNQMLFNVKNGTIDLSTGKIRAHRRQDLLTCVCPIDYDGNARCPIWISFLQRVLPGQSVIDYVQKMTGYWLTGLTSEQAIFFLYGVGANGKSTFMSTIMDLLGPYAHRGSDDLLIRKRGSSDDNATKYGELRGKRLVMIMESEEGDRLNESTIKELTGGDVLRGRFLYKDAFTFKPTHKFVIAMNYRPIFRGGDAAMVRRLRMLPFDTTIPENERDPLLSAKLKAELPGILNWAIEGCLCWQKDGLKAPESITIATKDWSTDQDMLGQFIEESCTVGTGLFCHKTEFHNSYKEWIEEQGESPVSSRRLGEIMLSRGFKTQKKHNGIRNYTGIEIKYGPVPDRTGTE